MSSTDIPTICFDSAPQLMSDRQVAFALDVSLEEVRRLRGRRLLPFIRFGREYLSKTEAVRELVRARSLRGRKSA